jgi:hypothetical protein
MNLSSDSGGDMGDEQSLDDPLLTGVLNELRSWGTGPAARPSAALASLFDATPPPPAPRRRRNMFTTKLAGLGLAAKVALGVGAVAAAATTAGVTSAILPSSAQSPTTVAVNAGVDVTLPGSTSTTLGSTTTTTKLTIPGDDKGDEDAKGAKGATGTGAGAATPTTAVHPDNHGGCVSEAAHNDDNQGRDHGQAVSAIARSDCGKSTASTSSTSSTTAPPTTVAGAASNRGPGNSNGKK